MYKTTFKGQDIEEDKIDFESLDYKNIKVLIILSTTKEKSCRVE